MNLPDKLMKISDILVVLAFILIIPMFYIGVTGGEEFSKIETYIVLSPMVAVLMSGVVWLMAVLTLITSSVFDLIKNKREGV